MNPPSNRPVSKSFLLALLGAVALLMIIIAFTGTIILGGNGCDKVCQQSTAIVTATAGKAAIISASETSFFRQATEHAETQVAATPGS